LGVHTCHPAKATLFATYYVEMMAVSLEICCALFCADSRVLLTALAGTDPLHFLTYDVVDISPERSYRILKELDFGDADF
jgi:hypothetical protein